MLRCLWLKLYRYLIRPSLTNQKRGIVAQQLVRALSSHQTTTHFRDSLSKKHWSTLGTVCNPTRLQQQGLLCNKHEQWRRQKRERLVCSTFFTRVIHVASVLFNAFGYKSSDNNYSLLKFSETVGLLPLAINVYYRQRCQSESLGRLTYM